MGCRALSHLSDGNCYTSLFILILMFGCQLLLVI